MRTTHTKTQPGQTILDDMPIRTHDTIAWTWPDGTTVLAYVSRVRGKEILMRCHHAGRSWTRRQHLPLFPSMNRRPFTTAELLETIE